VLSVGVVGLGYWGPNLARNINASAVTRLAALCDTNQERLASVGDLYPAATRFCNAMDLVADPDVEAVVVATPTSSHYELAAAALTAGKHVLLEKPMTRTSAEAENLIRLASSSGLTLMVDHIFMYSPAVTAMAELCRAGELGNILFVDSVRINLGQFQDDADVLWDLAPHDLSIIDHLLQRSPVGVIAVGASHGGHRHADVAHVYLDYGDDLVASLHLNWLSPVKIRHFIIGGSRKSVVYNDLDQSEPVKVYDRGIDFTSDPEGRRRVLAAYRSGDVVSPSVDRVEALQNAIAHFADCVRTGQEPMSGGEQGLRLLRILERATESMQRNGGYVRFQP